MHGANDRQRRRALHTGSAAWRRKRESILIRDSYTCRSCRRFGDQVDHVDGNDAHNDDSNLQTLCINCHSAKTARGQGTA